MYFKKKYNTKKLCSKSLGGRGGQCAPPWFWQGCWFCPSPPQVLIGFMKLLCFMCGSALLIRHTTKERKKSCRLLRGLNLYIYIFGLLYFPMVWFWLVFFLGRYFTCIFIVICLLILFFVLILIKFMFISSHQSMRDLCELISNKISSWT